MIRNMARIIKVVNVDKDAGLGQNASTTFLDALTKLLAEAISGTQLPSMVVSSRSIVLKPNWVKEYHPRYQEGWRWVITEPTVIVALVVVLRTVLRFSGQITILDAPQTDSSFERIMELCEFDRRFREAGLRLGVDATVLDIRKEEWTNESGVIVSRRGLPGDPLGYVAFDLGEGSEFFGHWGQGRYYGADYDSRELNSHHSGGRHEYLISRSVLEADLIISIPKLKTHKKAGVTGALKNLVGVNGDKNWLPHHTEPSWCLSGDERPDNGMFSRLERLATNSVRGLLLRSPALNRLAHRQLRGSAIAVLGDNSQVVRSGNWWGNDTTWRMCLDLNKVVAYGNSDGTLRQPLLKNAKPHFALVDALIAGEGNGPMDPDPVTCGCLILASEPAVADAVGAVIMGFCPEKIPIIRQAFSCRMYPLSATTLDEIVVESNEPSWNGPLLEIEQTSLFRFKPHSGWVGHIER
jgi:uncharacterized protein (DUF362 family)